MNPVAFVHSMSLPARVEVRRVYAWNLLPEFAHLSQALRSHPFVSLDTEFPGVLFHPTNHHAALPQAERYALLKANVDCMHLIQVGLTLTDAAGNLPRSPDGSVGYFWEFNFSDFDPDRDFCAPKSIEVLRSHGLNLERNRVWGICSAHFAELMAVSGLICNGSAITWVMFQGAYDFAYLIKILTRSPLPERLEEFLNLVKFFFGEKVYDIKHMVRYCSGVYGGLERVARALRVERAVGECHQAGSDSLLTCQVYRRMKECALIKDEDEAKYAGVFYGIE